VDKLCSNSCLKVYGALMAVFFIDFSITNINEACALSILGSLLVEGEKSPFYQSLIESNLGSDYVPGVG
jgi:Zn-dependent M16 (insulinase) family peptidase